MPLTLTLTASLEKLDSGNPAKNVSARYLAVPPNFFCFCLFMMNKHIKEIWTSRFSMFFYRAVNN